MLWLLLLLLLQVNCNGHRHDSNVILHAMILFTIPNCNMYHSRMTAMSHFIFVTSHTKVERRKKGNVKGDHFIGTKNI